MPEPAAPLRYAAFISYSHANEAEAARLHRALENFRLPKDIVAPQGLPTSRGRIAPVFRDREELSSSPDLSASIRAALESSSALVVICSPKARASRWVNEEIKLFKRLNGEGRVYALLIEGEPAEAFPPALLKKIGPDGELTETQGEPLAADIRQGKDGWKIGTLKIAAGLLDVGLDALRQREAQRERRRLMTAAGVSAGVAAGALGLAGWALYASDVANKQRARAERVALTAQRTADFMVELFEVPDPGESRGRQVTAKEILDEGVARIEGSLKDEPAVQGDLMYTMGRTYTGLGLYPDAARILGVARQKRVAAGADPGDQYATENALARALFEKGDLDAAKALYQKLVDEAERDIARGGWRVDYAVALTGMGETTLYRDTPEAAQKHYERARDLLAAHGMSETEEMAEALRGLAGALIELRRFSDAERILEQSKMYYINHNKHSYKMTTIMNDLAHVLYMQRKLPQAKEIALLALRSEIELLGDVHPETLITENNIARYEFELGDIRAAAERLSRVIEGQENLGLGDVVDFAFYLNTMGEIQNELGEYQAATAFLQKAAVLIRGNKHRLFGPIETNLGRAFCASGDTQVGLAHVVAGRVGLKDHYPDEDWRYGAADEFESRCRAKLGETEKARALAKSAYERLQEQLGQDHFFTKRAKTWMESLTG